MQPFRTRDRRHARMAVEWQRGRARKQLGQLERRIEELSITLAQIGTPQLPWTRSYDALDDLPVD